MPVPLGVEHLDYTGTGDIYHVAALPLPQHPFQLLGRLVSLLPISNFSDHGRSTISGTLSRGESSHLCYLFLLRQCRCESPRRLSRRAALSVGSHWRALEGARPVPHGTSIMLVEVVLQSALVAGLFAYVQW